MTQEVQQNWISGFWRRIGALLIDTLILGVVGFLLGTVLESTFVQLGGWGRVVGFGIALLYFGLMNSSLCNGQTVGKKLLKLRVVSTENQTIAPGRSVLRYIVLATPFYLNGAQYPADIMQSFLKYPLSMLIFGGAFSILYLYVFNRITRQSLHDLVVGTYVVRADVEKQPTGSVWQLHLIVVAILFVIAAIVPAVTGKLTQTEPFKGMLEVQSALTSEPEVRHASVATSTTIVRSANDGDKQTSYVSAQAFLKTDAVGDSELARRLALVVIKNYPQAREKDTLRITLTYGYDLVIWSQWSSHTHTFNPRELQATE